MTRQLSILIVDDDKDNALSLAELFEIEGHNVVVAYTGEEAISAYARTTFDIAFMDVMMPEKNGVESFLEIKRIQPTARVFMMTGYSVEELLRQAVQQGALGVLEKPFEPAEVLAMARDIGKNGLVVALPDVGKHNLGESICATLKSNGISSCHMRDASVFNGGMGVEDILVIDTQLPLIDSVSYFKRAQGSGHVAPTILVPPAIGTLSAAPLRDIGVTGILNKPFDPIELLNRLPHLAA